MWEGKFPNSISVLLGGGLKQYEGENAKTNYIVMIFFMR